MSEPVPVLVLLGPTAAGKTELSLLLAERLDGEILNADSTQVYKGMDIGTDKIPPAERRGIAHHLFDLVEPSERFSLADYQTLARRQITATHGRGRLPILVGGTGLYIRAVTRGFVLPENAHDPELRRRLEDEADRRGSGVLHARLSQVDPEAARRIHPNDRRRVIRALEVHAATGKPITYFQSLTPEKPPYQLYLLGVTRPREELYRRIDERVEAELAAGLVQEVEGLSQRGVPPHAQAMQALGYKEVAGYLAGRYSYEEMKRILKRNTRHFAKRQLTWFRKEEDVHWFDLSKVAHEEIIDEAVRWLEEIST